MSQQMQGDAVNLCRTSRGDINGPNLCTKFTESDQHRICKKLPMKEVIAGHAAAFHQLHA